MISVASKYYLCIGLVAKFWKNTRKNYPLTGITELEKTHLRDFNYFNSKFLDISIYDLNDIVISLVYLNACRVH